MKSLSFVMTIAFSRLAASNISLSSASRKPRLRIAMAFTAKLLLIQAAIAGDICASIQIVMRQAPDDLIYERHIEGQPANLLFRDQASLLGFVQHSNQQQ